MQSCFFYYFICFSNKSFAPDVSPFTGMRLRPLLERRLLRGSHWQIRLLLQGWLRRENLRGRYWRMQRRGSKRLAVLQRRHVCRRWRVKLHVQVRRPTCIKKKSLLLYCCVTMMQKLLTSCNAANMNHSFCFDVFSCEISRKKQTLCSFF